MDSILADLRRSLAAIEAGRAGAAAAPRLRPGQGLSKALATAQTRPAPPARPHDGPTSRASEAAAGEAPARGFSFGMAAVDAALGPLPAAALHEVRAASQNDGASAGGFTVALMLRALAETQAKRAVIVRQAMTAAEFGEVHGAGLLALGADPGAILLARARDGLSALQAGLEALRSRGIGAVAIETWGDPRALDLDATRRLSVAARRSGAAAFLLRVAGAQDAPSAAHVRWRVRGARSVPLAADAPGHPVFEIELLRHRAGLPQQAWRVEWNRDERAFRDPAVPVPVASLPRDRSTATGMGEAGQRELRRAG